MVTTFMGTMQFYGAHETADACWNGSNLYKRLAQFRSSLSHLHYSFV